MFMQTAKAVTWQTVSNGNWNAGYVWQGGVAPSSSSIADTFLIKHNINIISNLTLTANAFLQIDSTGGICGHYTVTVQSGASISKYGTLNLDVIDIPGGLVNCYKPGAVIITQYGVLSNGGQLSTYGCAFSVGPWFNCQFPNSEGIQTLQTPTFVLYPNPAQNSFTLEVSSSEKQVVNIIDISGKIVLTQTIADTTIINTESLCQGVYYVQVKTNTGIATQKIIIQH